MDIPRPKSRHRPVEILMWCAIGGVLISLGVAGFVICHFVVKYW